MDPATIIDTFALRPAGRGAHAGVSRGGYAHAIRPSASAIVSPHERLYGFTAVLVGAEDRPRVGSLLATFRAMPESQPPSVTFAGRL